MPFRHVHSCRPPTRLSGVSQARKCTYSTQRHIHHVPKPLPSARASLKAASVLRDLWDFHSRAWKRAFLPCFFPNTVGLHVFRCPPTCLCKSWPCLRSQKQARVVPAPGSRSRSRPNSLRHTSKRKTTSMSTWVKAGGSPCVPGHGPQKIKAFVVYFWVMVENVSHWDRKKIIKGLWAIELPAYSFRQPIPLPVTFIYAYI